MFAKIIPHFKFKNVKNIRLFELTHFTLYYNVYSLPRFEKFVYDLGVKNIEVYDFNINIDIAKKDLDYMGTYTEKLEDGNRLQISGAVVMLWKIIKIEI